MNVPPKDPAEWLLRIDELMYELGHQAVSGQLGALRAAFGNGVTPQDVALRGLDMFEDLLRDIGRPALAYFIRCAQCASAQERGAAEERMARMAAEADHAELLTYWKRAAGLLRVALAGALIADRAAWEAAARALLAEADQ